jgi:hypothetical protein
VFSTLSVDFSLLRVEVRLRLAGGDSEAICRLAEMDECGVEGFEVKEFEVKLKKFNGRCENRSGEFFSL